MSGERKDGKATITEWKEWPEKGNMRAIADRAKEKYTELEHKGWEWRSFYNGWLECFNDCVPYLKGLFHKELIGKLKQRTAYEQRISTLEDPLSKVTEERDRAVELLRWFMKQNYACACLGECKDKKGRCGKESNNCRYRVTAEFLSSLTENKS